MNFEKSEVNDNAEEIMRTTCLDSQCSKGCNGKTGSASQSVAKGNSAS